MDLLNLFTKNIVLVLTIIGILAFIVSLITEVTKGIGIFANIPTDLEVIVLSIILCLLVYFAYISYSLDPIIWYYIVACIIAAFIVAFVAMYGWDKITTLFYRFKFPLKKDETVDLPNPTYRGVEDLYDNLRELPSNTGGDKDEG